MDCRRCCYLLRRVKAAAVCFVSGDAFDVGYTASDTRAFVLFVQISMRGLVCISGLLANSWREAGVFPRSARPPFWCILRIVLCLGWGFLWSRLVHYSFYILLFYFSHKSVCFFLRSYASTLCLIGLSSNSYS